MKRLVANFSIQLPNPVLLSGPESNIYKCKSRIDGFDVDIELIPLLTGMRYQKTTDEFSTFSSVEVKILVATDLRALPPVPGIKDHEINEANAHEYFKERLYLYQKVALKAINRVIRFFRYKLHMPLLHEVDLFNQSLENPVWTVENCEQIPSGGGRFMIKPIPGLFGDSIGGIKPLSFNNLSELEYAIGEPIIPELYQQILADALDAIHQENLRRAVLEMAIAVEVLVRTVFFEKDTIAGATVDYLEDKGRLNLKVLELIDGVAKQVFGNSFKEFDKQSFTNIDYLFRSRNKVAHRGEFAYRDEMGKICQVDKLTLRMWWDSVESLLNWCSMIKKEQL
jgi:hypothetical protein